MSLQQHGVEAPNCACLVEWDQHGFADRIGDFEKRHDDARAAGLVDFPVSADLVQVANEAGAAASNQFDMVQPRHVNVGRKVVGTHDGCSLAGLLFSEAQRPGNHEPLKPSHHIVRFSQSGLGMVNGSYLSATRRAVA